MGAFVLPIIDAMRDTSYASQPLSVSAEVFAEKFKVGSVAVLPRLAPTAAIMNLGIKNLSSVLKGCRKTAFNFGLHFVSRNSGVSQQF